MFRPIKWLCISAAVLGGVGFLMFGSDLPSYVGTLAGSVKESIQGQIPIDLQLKRAEKLIREVEPQIDTCKRDVARAQVELEELQESINRLEVVVDAEQQKLRSGARLLSGDGEAEYQLASDRHASRRVEISLQRTLDSYRNNRAILKAKRALIERQMEAVSVAEERLGAVRAQKEQLEDEIIALKTQQKMIESLAASSDRFDLDDSALSDAKRALADVRKRLDIAQKVLENDMVFAVGEPLTESERRDILSEIAEEFDGETEMVEVGTSRTYVRTR